MSETPAPQAKPRRIVLQGWCSLLIPAAWHAEQAEGVTSLYNKQQTRGAVNVSLYRRQRDDAPPETELIDLSMRLARSLGAGLEPEKVRMVRLDGSPSARFELMDGERDVWHAWHVADETRVICLAYNCNVNDVRYELEEAERTITSFKWDNTEEQGG